MRPLLLLLLLPMAARAEKVEIPVDIGVGPAAYLITGPVYRDQKFHYGLKLSAAAVIDQETIRKHQNRIPAKYRQLASRMDEVRFTPTLFLPDSLIISPKIERTGIYGAIWRPLAVGVPILSGGALRFDISAGLVLTYFFLHSDVLPNTHFFRPGLDAKATFEVALTKTFLVSFGWASGFYVPQRLGDWLSVGPSNENVWHIGQPFLKFHYRFPLSVNL
jgi:hypothetical protein